ncbi:MAG: histidine kinase [Lachnospiraceae bacterium]|nr:histidine kinase [Lachnospiraceae bacterium]
MAEKVRSLPLNKKIKWIFIIVILLVSGIFMTIAAFFSVSMLTERSKDLTRANIETVTQGIGDLVTNFEETLKSLIPDEGIQAYLTSERGQDGYERAETASRRSLKLASSLKDNINFIALYKQPGTYIYRGAAINKSKFSSEYDKDLAQSIPWGKGDLSVSYDDSYFGEDSYTLTFYQPVYDMDVIGKEIGMLCINVNEGALGILKEHVIGDSVLKLYLADEEGTLLLSSDKEEIGNRIEQALDGNSGTWNEKNQFYIYRRIDNSKVYVVGEINNGELIYYNILTLSLLFLTILLILVVVLFLAAWAVRKTYEPLESLVGYMERVSKGNLDVRIDEKKYGPDFITLSLGFNHMLDNINQLMEQVKTEQHESAQIKLNALQAQIKPHFLYNALDCIRWQALSSGNADLALQVKALAGYYRTSLSRGKELISLEEELECAQNYMLLQNMRYDHVANLQILVDENWYDVEIPKMTLQPLLENAIYHGMKGGKMQGQGMILLRVENAADGIVLSVSDNGQGMEKEMIEEMNRSISVFDESFGYGVRNVNRRIELIYGSPYGLHYEKNEMGGITVLILLPGKE